MLHGGPTLTVTESWRTQGRGWRRGSCEQQQGSGARARQGEAARVEGSVQLTDGNGTEKSRPITGPRAEVFLRLYAPLTGF